MIKGLEALCYLDDIANGRKMSLDPHKLKLIVEKELKALEIIIKKFISPKDFVLCNYTLNNKKWLSYEEYKKAYMNYYEDDEYLLLEEEYEILKEVLE